MKKNLLEVVTACIHHSNINDDTHYVLFIWILHLKPQEKSEKILKSRQNESKQDYFQSEMKDAIFQGQN